CRCAAGSLDWVADGVAVAADFDHGWGHHAYFSQVGWDPGLAVSPLSMQEPCFGPRASMIWWSSAATGSQPSRERRIAPRCPTRIRFMPTSSRGCERIGVLGKPSNARVLCDRGAPTTSESDYRRQFSGVPQRDLRLTEGRAQRAEGTI